MCVVVCVRVWCEFVFCLAEGMQIAICVSVCQQSIALNMHEAICKSIRVLASKNIKMNPRTDYIFIFNWKRHWTSGH